MVITIHAGHNPRGKIACGASDYIDESTQSRWFTRAVARELKKLGVTVYNVTENNGASQRDVLEKICEKANSHQRDLDISIHFNAAKHEVASDGKTYGTECWVISKSTTTALWARDICAAISRYGFKNRGVKETKNLYVLNHTSARCILIEVCFVTDPDDAKIWMNHRKAIARELAVTISKLK